MDEVRARIECARDGYTGRGPCLQCAAKDAEIERLREAVEWAFLQKYTDRDYPENNDKFILVSVAELRHRAGIAP